MISLQMVVEQVDGQWVIDAPWLEEPVVAASWYDAYNEAVRLKCQGP